jgi:hypothetical protein
VVVRRPPAARLADELFAIQKMARSGTALLGHDHSHVVDDIDGGVVALAENSADAALLITLSPEAYTVQVTGKYGGSGIVLAEICDVTDL